MTIIVYKLDHTGAEVTRYPATVLQRGADYICLQATFQLETIERDYVTYQTGDHFIEWFYSQRWYNVFEIRDGDTQALKGYYCNVTRPAVIEADAVRADDLALDLFVKPDKTILLLDEDEYAALDLSTEERQAVRAAIAAIRQQVAHCLPPFNALASEADHCP